MDKNSFGMIQSDLIGVIVGGSFGIWQGSVAAGIFAGIVTFIIMERY